jgi:uncharacterized protein (DUF488 family)
VDVRAYPASRRHPQFARDALSQELTAAGISYEWHGKALGGMRSGGYAAQMETDEFRSAAAALAAMPGAICIMCAETDPADCHRSHIANWLVSRDQRVIHLLKLGERFEHGQPRLF